MQDLLAGNIDLAFDQAANSLPQVRAGQIRAYAVTAKTRIVSAPEIPTVDEAGLPGLYIAVWHGLWVPKGTPADAIAKILTATRDALSDLAVQHRFMELGQEDSRARPADARGASRLPHSRDQKVVADH